VFLGGFVVTSHLTFVARENKGHSFNTFINYLFMFSILCIINMILLGLYLRVAFKIHIGAIIIESLKDSFSLIGNLCRQIYS
jgi:putative flippase GtrA